MKRQRNGSKNTKALINTLRKIKNKGRYSDFPKAALIMRDDLAGFFNFTPATIDSLGKSGIIEDKNSEDEIIWSCNLINAHHFLINKFIELKSNYENYILEGNFLGASTTLNEIEANCGWSIWLIEAKFFCYQRSDGLEGNKNFLNEIYEAKVTDNSFNWVYYFAYLISERNEDGCDVDFFKFRQKSIINDITDRDFRSRINTIASYFVFDELLLNESEIKTILVFVQQYSIIDLYLLTSRILVENNYSSFLNKNKLALRILSHIKDRKLLKVKLLTEDVMEIDSDSFYIGKTVESVTRLDSVLLNPLLKAGVSLSSENKFINKYIQSISSIFSQDSDFEEAVIYVRSISLNLKHIDQIYGLIQVPSSLLSQRSSYYYSALSFFYSTVASDEELENAIEALTNKKVIDDINIIHKIEKAPNLLIEDSTTWIQHQISNFSKHYFTKLKFVELIERKEFNEAFELFVPAYIENTNLVHFFDLGELFVGKPWKFYKENKSFLDSSIILDAYLRLYNDEKQLFNAKACWRSFMIECGVRKPSELKLIDFKSDYQKYFYFLHKVCSTFNLGQDSLTYKSPREITIERIAICEKLLESESEREDLYDEIEELERQLAIADGIQEVDNVGLTVDQPRFYKEAKNKHLKSFERYKSLKALTLDMTSNNSYNQSSDENHLFKIPKHEGYSVMVSLLYSLSDIFLKNHEFGLDYYLSMRIRHGRFIGVTRGPLERNRLLTKYSNEAQRYTDNEYWINHYKHKITNESLKTLNSTLEAFSSSIDDELTKFIEQYIQINSDEKTNGIFNIEITNFMVAIIEDSITSDTSMDEYLSYVLEAFVLSLDLCSKHMKDMISQELQYRINNKLYNLQKDVTSLLNDYSDNALVNNIIAARTDMNNVFGEILTWFDISGENKKSIRTYTFDNIVEIGLARTKRIHQDFTPSLIIKNEKFKSHFHSNILAIMVDAFTILLSNIQEHGELQSPEITVEVINEQRIGHTSKLQVEIINPMQEKDVNFERLDKIRNEIISEDMKAQQEGGSGFHKLIALPYIHNKNDLQFRFEDGYFKVNITFTLSLI